MVDHDWTADSIRPVVLHTIEAFGVCKSMFASNFPVDKLYTDYATVYQAYEQIVKEAGFSQQDQVLKIQKSCHVYLFICLFIYVSISGFNP